MAVADAASPAFDATTDSAPLAAGATIVSSPTVHLVPRHMSQFRPRSLPRLFATAALALTGGTSVLTAQAPDAPFLRVRVDEARNRALLDIPAAQMGKDFLHQVTLTTGLGQSNGPGLDRAQMGQSVVVRLERRGNRVLMVRDNWSVRAPNGDAGNKQAASDAFPRSVVASFTVDGEKDGVTTVDATSLFLADAYEIGRAHV